MCLNFYVWTVSMIFLCKNWLLWTADAFVWLKNPTGIMKFGPAFLQVSILSAMELIWNLCEILFVEAATGELWTILV